MVPDTPKIPLILYNMKRVWKFIEDELTAPIYQQQLSVEKLSDMERDQRKGASKMNKANKVAKKGTFATLPDQCTSTKDTPWQGRLTQFL